MTDLYDRAAALPRLLRVGGRNPLRFAELRAAGIPAGQVRWRVRQHRIMRAFHDAYLPGSEQAGFLETLAAAQRLLPPSGAFSHHTAAALYGFGVIPSVTVHFTVPAGTNTPRRRGGTAHESAQPIGGMDVFGLRCLPPARCAVGLARVLPRPDALAVLDAALRVAACTPDELVTEVARHDGLRGVRQARELIPLAEPLAECRQETHMRLLLHDGQLPAPRPQLTVVDECGVVRFRLDLGYEEQRVGIEYDGASHLDRERLREDRHRHNWLATNGWRMRYFTDEDLYRRPDALVQMVRATVLSSRSGNVSSNWEQNGREEII